MSFKKIYKWGYDRKKVNRNVVKVKDNGLDCIQESIEKGSSKKNDQVIYSSIQKSTNSDYNTMVDEILKLQSKNEDFDREVPQTGASWYQKKIENKMKSGTNEIVSDNLKMEVKDCQKCEYNFMFNDPSDMFFSNECTKIFDADYNSLSNGYTDQFEYNFFSKDALELDNFNRIIKD